MNCGGLVVLANLFFLMTMSTRHQISAGAPLSKEAMCSWSMVRLEANSIPVNASSTIKYTVSSSLHVYIQYLNIAGISGSSMKACMVIPGTSYETSAGGPFHRDMSVKQVPSQKFYTDALTAIRTLEIPITQYTGTW